MLFLLALIVVVTMLALNMIEPRGGMPLTQNDTHHDSFRMCQTHALMHMILVNPNLRMAAVYCIDSNLRSNCIAPEYNHFIELKQLFDISDDQVEKIEDTKNFTFANQVYCTDIKPIVNRIMNKRVKYAHKFNTVIVKKLYALKNESSTKKYDSILIFITLLEILTPNTRLDAFTFYDSFDNNVISKMDIKLYQNYNAEFRVINDIDTISLPVFLTESIYYFVLINYEGILIGYNNDSGGHILAITCNKDNKYVLIDDGGTAITEDTQEQIFKAFLHTYRDILASTKTVKICVIFDKEKNSSLNDIRTATEKVDDEFIRDTHWDANLEGLIAYYRNNIQAAIKSKSKSDSESDLESQ